MTKTHIVLDQIYKHLTVSYVKDGKTPQIALVQRLLSSSKTIYSTLNPSLIINGKLICGTT